MEVPDYPKPGISFKDITPLLQDPVALRRLLDQLTASVTDNVGQIGIDKVIGAEARGFILGAALAERIGAGFIPTRKPNKLPRETVSVEYQLEYGTDSLHMHVDAIDPGDKVLIHDDLLATGGTAAAATKMLTEVGAEIVGYSFIVELPFLSGRDALPGAAPVFSLFSFDS